jgi:hypothetical protein
MVDEDMLTNGETMSVKLERTEDDRERTREDHDEEGRWRDRQDVFVCTSKTNYADPIKLNPTKCERIDEVERLITMRKGSLICLVGFQMSARHI